MTGACAASMWEEEVAAFEQADRRQPPPLHGVVFTGSSSIRMWPHLAEDFAPLPVVGRGFGGAHVDAIRIHAPRIVLPYRPQAVVIYAGENDLEADTGKTPESVLVDMTALLDLIEAADVATRCYVLSIKLSPARRDRWRHARRLNGMLQTLCESTPTRRYVDVAGPMLGQRATQRRKLFLEDGLHLSAAGYALWRDILRPALLRDFPVAGRGGAA